MQANFSYDLWANGYDKYCGLSYEANTYPFAGHKMILAKIYNDVLVHQGNKVLDIGFGTALLSFKLYEKGVEIYGQELAKRLIDFAKSKMPKAELYRGDIVEGIVPELKQYKYDVIIATYALHHLSDAQKVKFIKELMPLLNEGGSIYIGDIAFKSRDLLEKCKAEAQNKWDHNVTYFVYDELVKAIPELKFEAISDCSAILSINK